MKFKNKKIICLTLSMLLLLSGCGADKADSKMNGSNKVQETIDQQIAEESSEATTEATTEATSDAVNNSAANSEGSNKTSAITEEQTTEDTAPNQEYDESQISGTVPSKDYEPITDSTKIDVDLTSMDSTMVYSTVYQMLADGPSYVDQVIKMDGTYYSSTDPDTGQIYHFVIIQDATACCQQGMEFIWDDGSHVYPDDYPADETRVSVIGTFETYKDNPDDQYQYCHLVDASLEIIQDTDQEVNQ